MGSENAQTPTRRMSRKASGRRMTPAEKLGLPHDAPVVDGEVEADNEESFRNHNDPARKEAERVRRGTPHA